VHGGAGGVGCNVLCTSACRLWLREGDADGVYFVSHLCFPEVVAHAVLVSLVLHTELNAVGGSVSDRAQTVVPVAELHDA